MAVGSSVPYTEWLPEEGQARCVQIDLDGSALAMRYPLEVPLLAMPARHFACCCLA